ncbi:MAG: hypothetical protein S4CHLAM2_17680 [Chlamydiales bacterium]|nr:hypothetical protein [Chlamydiales bacterium]
MSSSTNATKGSAYKSAPPTESTNALDRALPPEVLAYIFSNLSNSGLQQAAWVSRSCCGASIVTARRREAASVEAFTEFLAGQLSGERHLGRREKLREIGRDKRIFKTTSLLGIKSAQRAIGKEIALTLMGLSASERKALEAASKDKSELTKGLFDLAKACNAIKKQPNTKARAEAYTQLFAKHIEAENSTQILVEIVATTQRGEDELLEALANLCIEKGLLDEAFRVAEGVSNTEIKDKVLGTISREFSASEQVERAVDAACAMSEGSSQRRAIIENISHLFVDQDKLALVLWVAAKTRGYPSQESWKNYAYDEIIGKKKPVADCLALAQEVPDPNLRGAVLGRVASMLTEKRPGDAQAILLHVPDEWKEKSFTQQQISTALLIGGQVDEALALALTITDDTRRSFALKGIPSKLAQRGDFDHALEIAAMLPEREFNHRKNAFLSIARELIKAKEPIRALEIALTIPECDQYYLFRTDLSIALKEQSCIDAALQMAHTMSIGRQKDFVLGVVAQAYLREMKVDEAIRTISMISGENRKVSALHMVVNDLVDNNVLDQAYEVAITITIDSEKNNALRDVAYAYREVGNLDRAQEIEASLSPQEGCMVQ